MPHCININSQEYIDLVKQTKLSQRELKARIATWQEINNNYDRFPSIEEVEGLLNITAPLYSGSYSESLFLDKIFPNVNSESLSTSIDNLITNSNNLNDSYSTDNLSSDLNYLDEYSGSKSDNYLNSMGRVFTMITSPTEKKNIFNKIDGNLFETISEMYNSYIDLSYSNGIDKDIIKVLDRIVDLRNALNEKGSIIKSYIRSINKKEPRFSEDYIRMLHVNRDHLFGNNNISTAKELLTKLDGTLPKYLLKYLPKDSIEVELLDTLILTNDDNTFTTNISEASGFYNYDTNKITLSLSGLNRASICHEIIHAITTNFIKNNPENSNVKELLNLYNIAKSKISDKNIYGLEDEFEFISEALSNKEFKNLLKGIELENNDPWYKRFINTILRILNIKSKSNLYDEAFVVASNIMEESRDYINNEKEDINSEVDKKDLKKLVNSFSLQPSPVTIINSPYTEAFKRLNNMYSLQEIKDLSSSITSIFSDIVSWYNESNTNLSREEIIDWITPQRLFEEVKEELEIKLDSYIDNNVNQSYIDNIKKLLDNFTEVSLISTSEINFVEGLKFNTNDLSSYKYDLKDELDNGVSQEEQMSDEVKFHEYSLLDGWMKNFRYESVNNSLTNKLKRALRNVNEIDKNGRIVINSIGMPRKLNLDIIKNDLLRNMQSVITAKDVLPALNKLAIEKQWVNSLISELENDNELESQFYSVFKKDFTKFSIVNTSENSDGTVSSKIMLVNQSNDLNLWLEEWRNNLENSNVGNNSYSVYNSDNSINIGNVLKNIEILNNLIKDWNTTIKENNINLRRDFISKNLTTIKDQLNAIGISLTEEETLNIVKDALVDYSKLNNIFGIENVSYHLDSILSKLSLTNSWIRDNQSKINSPIDIIQSNNSNYSSIALLVSRNNDELIEGAVHENGKSYYTYLQPSYLTKLIKQVKVLNNKDFIDFVNKEFKQYIGTIYNENTNTFNISWLNDLVDEQSGKKKRDLIDHKVVLNYNKTDYDSLSSEDYQLLLLTEYFSNKDVAWFHVPILAEAPSAEFIKFDKVTVNFKDNIADKLLDLFTYEYNRIRLVRARKEGIKNGTIEAINNFDNKGDRFHFLEFLNDHLSTIDSIINKQGEYSEVLPSELFDYIKEVIITNLDIKANSAISFLHNLGVLEKNANGKYINLNQFGINENNLQNKLEEYFYNSYLATANIIQLTSTDLSYYKNIEDFQKRNKEIHAPGTMVNTLAKYNGERVGKDNETYIVLKDYEQSSTNEVLSAIKEIVNNNNLLSKIEKESIINKYLSNNVTDAQAFRSLDSAKTVITMSTGWNDKLENSYQRLKKGQWDMEDYNNIIQTFKPFVYTQSSVDSGILLDPNDPTKGNKMIKVPIQHKNSEAILLPMIGMQFNSPKLRGIMQAMQENDLDVVMFESAVKVGLQGVLDINNMNDRREIANYIKSFRNNNQVFKTISYEDYKIQQPIPEHLQDASQLFGTQLRKLALSDISPDAKFNIRGKELNKKQLLKLYNNLIIENTLEPYNNLNNDFKDINSLQGLIENEIKNNSRYSKDLLNACQLNNNGEFVLPLFDPSQSRRIQQLLNSVIKSRITNQKIKGGKAVQVSSYGLSDTLEIKFHEVNGQKSIDYIECYLPFWSEKIPKNWEYNGFIDPNTGIMDINKMLSSGIIDEEFLEGIIYRIPTEDKYSMWPIKVKGFLPRNSGGNIILPREITTITGSDFDIDSMYLMLKEFTFNQKEGKFKTIKPDINKDPQNLSIEERNNLLIDIIRGVLSHPDTAIKQLNPGNFDEPKKTARRLNILASGNNYSWEQLEKMSLEELDKISERNKLDILDFTTQIFLHKQNMTAAKLIGIIANHSTNHAIRQNTNIEVSPIKVKVKNKEDNTESIIDMNRFTLNGKFLTSLHNIINPSNNAYISKNYASFLAASVDAIKDTVLAFFNLNTFTADSAMLLTGLGYSFDEIGLLLRQPIIEELVSYYDKNVKRGTNKSNAIKDVLNKYKNILTVDLQTPVLSEFEELRSMQFKNSDLARMISTNQYIKNSDINDRNKYGDIAEFYQYQYRVLLNYKNILEAASELSDFISATRADTSGGGAGPTIANTKFKLRRIDKNIANANPTLTAPILLNTDIINYVEPDIFNNINNLRDYLRNSELGFIQGFTTLGLQSTEYMLSRYFPHYNKYFDYVFNKFEDSILKSGKLDINLMNKIYEDFFTYYMSQFEEFSKDNFDNIIREFPYEFLEMKNKYEELGNMNFIKNIKFINSSIPKLKFISGGKLSSNVRDNMIMEWESLLYKPKFRDLAIKLFKYNYYVNGFSFGSSSFMHLAPTILKLNIPNYVKNLNKLIQYQDGNENNRFTNEQLDIFIEQFIKNHLEDRKIVPEVSSISEDLLLDENNNIREVNEFVIPKGEIEDLFTNNGSTIPFVMIKVNKNKEYFKVIRNSVDSNDSIVTTLIHILPLGIKNNYLEYDFNNSELYPYNNNANEVYGREDYDSLDQDVTMSQDANENYYNNEDIKVQDAPTELLEHFSNAFEFISNENEQFKTNNPAFQSLTENDAPKFVRDYNQVDNDISNSPDISESFQSLIDEVSKEEIEKYKNNCK